MALHLIGIPWCRWADRADGRPQRIRADAWFCVCGAANLWRQLLWSPHPRNYRNAGRKHRQLRSWQSACAAHDRPLRLRKEARKGPMVGPRSDGPPIFGPPPRILRRRGQRPDFSMVCILGLGVLSRMPRVGRIHRRFAAIPKGDDPFGKR